MNIYESDRLLNEYLLFHYGTVDQIMPWSFGPKEALHFPQRSVTDLLDVSRLQRKDSGATALDLGCAVGRSCYALAEHCGEALGIDYSQAFIEGARQLLQVGHMSCVTQSHGHETHSVVVQRPEVTSDGSIHFEQGDAMHLRTDLGAYDVVHAANLLCRLPTPLRLLQRLPRLVKPGGQLLLTTPCTWLEDFTPPDRWPPGSTLAWLKEHLAPDFQLELELDMPFLIRETARKFQWTVALGTRWVRRTE